MRRVRRVAGHVAPLAPAASVSVQSCASAGTSDVDLDKIAYGFMASQALFTALEMGIFNEIAKAGQSGVDVASLQQRCNCDSPRLQTLLTSLVAIKCLRRGSDASYTLSPNTAKYMVSSSKHFYGDYLKLQIGRQFYHRMGDLRNVMSTGRAPDYAAWFSNPEVADTYTQAQHNGSVATARYIVNKLQLVGSSMLDVGGGSGAFSYVFVGATPGLEATVLELPEVCRAGEKIRLNQPLDVQNRVRFVELDATTRIWPVRDGNFDIVLMSYLCGSVPESAIQELFVNAYRAMRPGGRLLIHDFMVDDNLDGPLLGALWGLQHVTVNAEGLGLCPKEVIPRLCKAGFDPSRCVTTDAIRGMTKLIVAHKDI